MTKYIFVFGSTYLAALIAYLVISTLVDISGSANIGMLLVAAIVTSLGFVKNEERAPTPEEKRVLVWASFFAACVISCALVAVFLFVSPDGPALIAQLKQVSATIWLIAFAVVTLIHIVVLNLCYGWAARKFAARKYGG
jgi:hypothetical protein